MFKKLKQLYYDWKFRHRPVDVYALVRCPDPKNVDLIKIFSLHSTLESAKKAKKDLSEWEKDNTEIRRYGLWVD